jgi:hypothetical protein
MSAESIIDKIAERTGWNDASKLSLALVYIDNQQSDDAWEDFLVQAADEECVEDTVTCKFCGEDVPADTAHLHDGSWVGDECCWDERLKSTE